MKCLYTCLYNSMLVVMNNHQNIVIKFGVHEKSKSKNKCCVKLLFWNILSTCSEKTVCSQQQLRRNIHFYLTFRKFKDGKILLFPLMVRHSPFSTIVSYKYTQQQWGIICTRATNFFLGTPKWFMYSNIVQNIFCRVTKYPTAQFELYICCKSYNKPLF